MENPTCYKKLLEEQLAHKMQECEKLKSQIDEDYNYYTTELKTLRDIISNKEKRNAALSLTSDRYCNALEEIEEYANTYFDKEVNKEIFDIINKAKNEKGKT